MPPLRKVAVVGAGMAGLVAARELLGEGLTVVVFEKSSRVGVIWAYDPCPDHGCLYESLRTNLPRELMAFSGCGLAGRVFAGDPRMFPGHQEMLAFLNAFAEEFDIARRIRFQAEVLSVVPVALGHGQEGWTVVWRGEAGEVAEEVFDAVVVCNGHHMVPMLPEINVIGNWRGKQMHSNTYRTPELFRDEDSVPVELILPEKSQMWPRKCILHQDTLKSQDKLGKMGSYKNVWIHPEVDCIQDDGKLHFADGSTLAADTIIFCTGYRYDFPFINLEGFTVDDNRVGPLYKHVFPPKYAPSLSFIGIPIRNILFQTYELQSKWVAQVLSGRAATLQSEENMLASVQEHYRRMDEAGRAKRHTHVLMPKWVEYMNWLADQVGEAHLEPQRCNLYEKAIMRVWSVEEGYRDKWAEEEDQVENSTWLIKSLHGARVASLSGGSGCGT